MTDYTKLGDLVDSSFTVLKVRGFGYKKWDSQARKMLFSSEPSTGFRKIYTVETNKGVMDLSASQYGTLLESTSKDGQADIINWTFTVKSNGKSDKDIRYFLNPVWNKPVPDGPANNAPLPEDDDLSRYM